MHNSYPIIRLNYYYARAVQGYYYSILLYANVEYIINAILGYVTGTGTSVIRIESQCQDYNTKGAECEVMVLLGKKQYMMKMASCVGKDPYIFKGMNVVRKDHIGLAKRSSH